MSMTTLKSLCKRVHTSNTFGARVDFDKQDDWQRNSNGYTCRLSYQRRTLTVDFWIGSAHTAEPTSEDLLSCLLSDAQSGELSFEDFCSEFGYDADSRKAERTWNQCVQMSRKLRQFLGTDFDKFLTAEQ